MLEAVAVLATINVEFHVKCDLPHFLNWVPHSFECFLSISSCWSPREVRKPQEVYDKSDKIRKAKPAENYNRITFTTSY